MSPEKEHLFTLHLEGEWRIEQAPDLLQQVAGGWSALLKAAPPPACVEIDLAKVREIDACGGQLLALLQEQVRLRGMTPRLSAVPPTVRERLALLGYLDGETGGEGGEP
ncbi:STAS domain-containing protein [Geomonas sp. Red32]|uniref:STAS domain-containing protein n=1 Tax=Geomonas sp. Red32 TaxID=2912856 RepID=UPI00202CDEDD|nr:STAS domain-containing protein [Geomonas sp. Red32]MCM0082890.1 STAS domain-containing protein [Geomonas sp. Red32]